MRLALFASLAAAALVTPLASCGGDDGGSGTITDPGTWLDTYVGRLCAKAHECKTDFPDPGGGLTFEDFWGADATACKTTFLTPADVRASVTAGKVTFDANAGAQCLAMLNYEAQACPDFWNTADPAVCSNVFTGTVANGGACTNSLECMTGARCDTETNTCMAAGAAPGRKAQSNLNAALAGR